MFIGRGIKIDNNKPLSEVLDELLEVENTDNYTSISGTIVRIGDGLHILSKVAYQEILRGVASSIKVNWALISLESGNRFWEPMPLEELFNKMNKENQRYFPIKVMGHMCEYKQALYNIVGIREYDKE